MIYLLAFVVLVLASARATRVLFYDEIAAPLRRWVVAKWPEPSWPAKIIGCYWCSGFWISATTCLMAATALPTPGTWREWAAAGCWYVLATFAVAYGASWVLDKEGIADGGI